MSARALFALAALSAGCGDDSTATVDAGGDASSAWSAAPAVPGGGSQETAVVALDGKVYVIGGFNDAIQVVDTVRIFDTATSTWSLGPALPRPLHHANAAVVDGTVYVLGALTGGNFAAIGDVYAWNPTTDAAWTSRTSMPAGTERGSAVTGIVGDLIYVAGGTRMMTVALLSSYSTTTDTWDTSLPAVPQPLEHGCGGIIGGKLYVLGGRYQGNTPLAFEYTPGGAWAQRAPMPTARSGMGCGVSGNRIIAAGGEPHAGTPTGVFADVEAYTASTDAWTTLPAMITPRHGMGAVVVDGALYVPGGATSIGFAAVDTHEVLQL